MLKGITSEKEIRSCRKLLKERLKSITSKRIPIRYSSPGGVGELVNASYSQEYNIWWYFSGKTDQYWNPFGKGEPSPNKAVTGRCQINMNKKGLNRSVGGTFAKDENGDLFLMHNGTIGGGHKGISKVPFLNWYPAPLLNVEFDGEIAQYFIVAQFSAENFHEQIRFFVDMVYEFKESIGEFHTEPKVRPKGNKHLNTGESLFRNPYTLPERTVLPGANHAMITNELLRCLRADGFIAKRNRYIDSYILNESNEITHIFEVKSSISSQSLYTAIGQLMVYGLKLQSTHIIVLDSSISKNLKDDLLELGIKCITFSWKAGKPFFGNFKI